MLYALDYSKLENIAVGSAEEIRQVIQTKASLTDSQNNLRKNDIIEKVEAAAPPFGLSELLYFDTLGRQGDLCFALSKHENAGIYAQTTKRDLVAFELPSPIGFVRYKGDYYGQGETASDVYDRIIREEIPISYGMWTLLRIRSQADGILNEDKLKETLQAEMAQEKDIDDWEYEKWQASVAELISTLQNKSTSINK